MKYKSKIDWWFHLCVVIFAIFTGYVIYAGTNGNPTMLLAAIMFGLMFFLFLLPTYLMTYYVMGDNALTVRSGLFSKKVIPYNMIVSCQPGSVTGDSAALSRDRLVITYFKNSKKKNVIVSPKDKFDFVTELKLKQKESGSDNED